MLQRKIAGFTLSLLMLIGSTGAVMQGAPLFARAETEEPPAAQTVTALDRSNAELFLPASYEQYLPLENPSYMAMNESCIAISDGTKLYLYDKSEGSYSVYQTRLPNNATVEKIQLTDDGRCFFSAGGLFYEYFRTENTASEITDVACATFHVEGDFLYTVRMSENRVSLIQYSLDNLTREGEYTINTVASPIRPKLTAMDGKLYCVRNNEEVHVYDVTLPVPEWTGSFKLDDTLEDRQISSLQFICAYGDSLYYTVNGIAAGYPNGLYRSDFRGNAESVIEGDGFTAVAAYGDELYCIRNSSVLGLSVDEEGVKYSGYEIATSSPSVNRLSDARDSVRAGNLLVVADAGNRRVSVYDYAQNSYSVIGCDDPDFLPVLVATDGETIACASGTNIYVCKYGEPKFGAPVQTTLADVKGLACVYGSVYYATNAAYGKAGDSAQVAHDYGTPERMTRDLYGNIFVSYRGGSSDDVYSFTEQSFLIKNGGTKLDYTVPREHTSLRSDYEGNLYCLAGGKVYRNGEEYATIEGTDFIYHQTGETGQPVSFALGFEDGAVYFLFGNYGVRSNEETLDIPTLDKIAAEGAREQAFGVHDDTRLFVDIPAGEIGIRTDLSALKTEDSPYFPYAGYYRLAEDRRGVLLATTDKHYLVLTGGKQSYTAALFRVDGCETVDRAEYATDVADGEKTAYLSSEVSAYYAPALDKELTDTALARGLKVRVLSFIQAPEREYARIEYEDVSRAAKTGYVPKSYLSDVSPFPAAGDEYFSGHIKADREGIEFLSDDGGILLITERTAAKFTEQEDGSFLARIEKDGVVYRAYVTKDQVDFGNSDALRISLIIILTVLALVTIGAYVFLLPRKTAQTERDGKKSTKKANNRSAKS